MRMLRTTPFFSPKSGEKPYQPRSQGLLSTSRKYPLSRGRERTLGTRLKPYLEVLSRFGLWRDFLNDNIQATISAFRLIKTKPNQWNFTSATLTHIRFVFYHNIKDNERDLCQELLTIENTDSDLKLHALHYANELLVRVRLSFQILLQNRSTYRNNTKKLFGKRVTTRTRCR